VVRRHHQICIRDRGTSDDLAPELTVWRAPDQSDDSVKYYLTGLLGDLVPARGIVIAE